MPETGRPGSESGGRKRAHGCRTAARRESAGQATEPLPATRLPSTPHESGRYPDIERLFGVSTAPAAPLMQTFGAEMTGYQENAAPDEAPPPAPETPGLIVDAGPDAVGRFLEFFAGPDREREDAGGVTGEP